LPTVGCSAGNEVVGSKGRSDERVQPVGVDQSGVKQLQVKSEPSDGSSGIAAAVSRSDTELSSFAGS
jgi:hypothetical protein